MLVLLASMVSMTLPAGTPSPQPRLLVGIMVEGLERDYLDLLRESFGSGGFNRLLRDGVVISDADYGTNLDNVAATAVVMTGASPVVSGIPASAYYDPSKMKVVEVLDDPQVMGNFTTETYSPAALRVSTVSDEARIAGGGVTQAYSIAPDARVAILMAGHAGNGGVWINDNTGAWASSTYYTELPAGVATANRLMPLSSRLDTMSWVPSAKAEAYPNLPDHLTHYPFRYVFPRGKDNRYAMFKDSPLVNREVTSLASDFIGGMKLGTHDGVDVLNVAYTLTSFDYSKNPDNRFEMMDAYIKLDRNLEQLFAAIDRNVGVGNSVVYLAATPQAPRAKRDDPRWRIPTGEFSTRKAGSLLNMYLMAVYGTGEWVSAFHNNQFYLNNKLIKERSLDARTVRTDAAGFLARMTGVEGVYTIDDVIVGRLGDRNDAIRRNTDVAIAGDLFINILPGWELVDDYATVGPDRHTGQVNRVTATTGPVFILAPNVPARVIDTPVDARVIAPTVARLLRIRSPNGASLPALPLD